MQIQKLPSVRSLVYTPVYLFILIFFCLSIILGVITAFLPEPDLTGGFTTDSIVLDWLITVIAVPLIETLLFQTLIIEIICKLIKRPRKSIWIAVIVSSSAFALNHTYSTAYIIITFLGGFILALAYYLGRYRKENAVLLVFIIHSLYNLSSTLYNFCIYGLSV